MTPDPSGMPAEPKAGCDVDGHGHRVLTFDVSRRNGP